MRYESRPLIFQRDSGRFSIRKAWLTAYAFPDALPWAIVAEPTEASAYAVVNHMLRQPAGRRPRRLRRGGRRGAALRRPPDRPDPAHRRRSRPRRGRRPVGARRGVHTRDEIGDLATAQASASRSRASAVRPSTSRSTTAPASTAATSSRSDLWRSRAAPARSRRPPRRPAPPRNRPQQFRITRGGVNMLLTYRALFGHPRPIR